MRAAAALLAGVALSGAAARAGDAGDVELVFFWSEHCPHCHDAAAFLEALRAELPWLVVESLELSRSEANRRRYAEVAAELGEEARYVPAFAFCGTLRVGFDGATTGAALREAIVACREPATAGGTAPGPGPPEPIRVRGLGSLDPASASLPVTTVVIASLDAFNPCAFFVLLFLLSLLVHARSRPRILLVGGVFVFFSGAIYFVFMAAWLNAFLLMRELRAVTAVAGAVAVALALVNVKDFFWLGRGVSLSIPQSAKPGLFRRMRGLTQASSLPAMLLGTVALAIAANSYELLCTAGFPLVFTRILTLRELPTGSYYLYLLLYNAVYVVPLATAVGVFAWTLGSRKLQEREGRALKLLSGLMMLGLGLLLIFAPDALQNVGIAVGLLLAALLATAGFTWLERRLRPA